MGLRLKNKSSFVDGCTFHLLLLGKRKKNHMSVTWGRERSLKKALFLENRMFLCDVAFELCHVDTWLEIERVVHTKKEQKSPFTI